MFVTLADYERENRTTVPPELREHVLAAIQAAEDDLLREVGYNFYGDEPEGVPGRDWRRLASWRATEYVAFADEAYRESALSPFQSEAQGRYSYTLRTPSGPLAANPRFASVLRYYRGLATATVHYRPGVRARDEYS